MSDDFVTDEPPEPFEVVDEPDAGPLPEGVTVGEDGRFYCPDCERSYKNVDDLQKHRRLRHAFKSNRKRGRPKGSGGGVDGSPRRSDGGSGRRQRRERQVKETLQEIVSFSKALKGETVDVQSLIDVIDRDKAKMATGIAYIAERFNPLGTLIDLTMGHGGIITIAQGFSGIGRWVLVKWRIMLAQREQPEQVETFFASELEEQQAGVDGDPYAAG